MTGSDGGVFTIDASVFVSSFKDDEPHHVVSMVLLRRLLDASCPVVVPTLFVTEVAAALARGGDQPDRVLAFVSRLVGWPDLCMVPLDATEARRAAETAAKTRLRASDAIYVAVARRYGSTLVSLDQQQLERAAGLAHALSPGEALASLTS